jgi:transposase
MIRSSKHSIKFTNQHKLDELKIFIQEYRTMVKKYINIIWNEYLNDPPSTLDNNICKLIETRVNNDSRIRQCAAKQACSMVKAIIAKQNKRKYKLSQLMKEGKNTRYLQRKIDNFVLTKPKFENINIELDSRFIDFELTDNHFNMFVRIKQIGNKREIKIPIKFTFTSNKWNKLGQIKNSIRLNGNNLTLYFDVREKENNGTKIIGADQGQITCLSLSDGQTTIKDKDGYDLNKIQDVLSRRKKGSKGFKRAQSHRKNYINWSLNQLNFDDVKELKFEKILNIRKGKRSSRKLSHWTYTLIKSKLIRLSEDKGFIFTEQDNKFMSQRCSECGWTHKSNRKGKTFICTNTNCNNVMDSDINAASNHEVSLIELPLSIWQGHINRSTGFYWLKDRYVLGKEIIVPCVKKE